MSGSHMERFWDERAKEDAYYFVDSRLDYRDPDEQAFWAGGEDAVDKLLAAVGAPAIQPQHHAVDIGCGLGRLSRVLAGRAARVTGIDVSSEMLARAKELNAAYENIAWVHGDGESLQPIADASADVCLTHVVFRHIPDPAIILGYVRDIGRVLKPGGFAVIEFSNAPEPHRHEFKERFGRLAALFGRAPKGVTDEAWVGSEVAIDDLRAAAGEAGLTVDRLTGEGTQFCVALLTR